MFMSPSALSRLTPRAASSIATPLSPGITRLSRPTPFHLQRAGLKMAYSDLRTPEHCYVDFCLVPLGTGSTSISHEIAEVQRVLKSSGLSYTMHSAGTTVEGSWDDVMKTIGQAHSAVHKSGAVRIQSSMRVGSRTDRVQTAAEKIKSVQDKLAQDGKK